MPTATYDLIDSTLLSSTAYSVTFSGISGYRDLRVVIRGYVQNGSFGSNFIEFRYNGVTSPANYDTVTMYRDYNGSNVSTQPATDQRVGSLGDEYESVIIADIIDAGASDKDKTALARSYARESSYGPYEPFFLGQEAMRYLNSSAITQLQIYSSVYFEAGTEFELWGIVS